MIFGPFWSQLFPKARNPAYYTCTFIHIILLDSTASSSTSSSNQSSLSKRGPFTEDQLLSKIQEMGDQLKQANTRIAELSSEVDDLKLEGKDMEANIRSLIKRNIDLERRLSEYEADEDVVHSFPQNQGPKLKPWEELKPRQKRRKSQAAFDAVKKTAESRSIEPQQLLGTLLHRY